MRLLRRIRRLLSRNRWLRVPLDALDLRLERGAYRLWVWRARARLPKGLPLGSRAPRFHFLTLEHRMLTLDALLEANAPVMLFFVADPATAVWDELLAEVTTEADQAGVTIAIVSREPERGAAISNGLPAGKVLFQHHWEMLKAYRIYEIPSAVLVDADGTIGTTVAAGVDEIRELAATTVAGLTPGARLPARGEPRPGGGPSVAQDP